MLDLATGLLLEDLNIKIPWGASVEQLRHIANPHVHELSDRIVLAWNNHVIFSGLKCQVTATFLKERKTELLPYYHPNTDGRLSLLSLNFRPSPNQSPREQHRSIKEHLIRVLGYPSYDGHGDVPFSDLPFTEWDLADALIVLMVFERFGEYCKGEIWRKPLPAWRKPKHMSF